MLFGSILLVWENSSCDGMMTERGRRTRQITALKSKVWCFLIPFYLQGIDPINQTKVVEILKEGDGTERRRSLGGSVKYENATDGSEEVSMGVEWSGVSTRHHQEWPQLAAGGKGQPGSGLSPRGLSWHPCLPPFVPCILPSPLSWHEPAHKGARLGLACRVRARHSEEFSLLGGFQFLAVHSMSWSWPALNLSLGDLINTSPCCSPLEAVAECQPHLRPTQPL